MKKWMHRQLHEKQRTWALAGLALLFVVSWAPLLAIARYAFPSCDDFSYTNVLYQSIQQNLSFAEICRNAWAQAMMFYHYWQGRYVDDIVSAFAIGVAVPKYYAVSVCLVQVILISGVIALGREVLQKRLGWNPQIVWSVILICVSWMLLYLPYAAEGFYWYVGATGYTMTFGWMLWMLTGLLAVDRMTHGAGRICAAIGTMIVTVLVAGSNYATGILAAELLVIWVVLQLIGRFGGTQMNRSSINLSRIGRSWLFALLVLIEYVVAFGFNALSAGNHARMNNVDGLAPLDSIMASLQRGGAFLIEWMHLPVLIFLVMMVLLSWQSLAAMKYRFRMPLLIMAVSYGLMSSIMTPSYFASATWGPGRLINIVYLSYVLLLTFNVLYVTGWVLHIGARRSDAVGRKETIGIVLIGMILLVGGLKYYGLQSTNSTSAALSMLKGEAQQYRLENETRWTTYEAGAGEDVVVPDFSVKPYVLYHDDITVDADDWRNGAVKDFFGLNSVKLEAVNE